MSRNLYSIDMSGVEELIADIISQKEDEYLQQIEDMRSKIDNLISDNESLVEENMRLEQEVADLKVWHERRNVIES